MGSFKYRSGSLSAKNVSASGDAEIPRVQTMGLFDAVTAVNTFPFDAVTSTEATAAYCKSYDASATTYSNLATTNTNYPLIYAANYQIFPTTEGVGDAIYFGASSKFGVIYMDMSATVGTYSSDAAVWEYYNGLAWGTFTPYDYTDSTAQDGKRPFQRDGYIILNCGPDWVVNTISSQEAYWVRCRLTAATMTQAPLTNSKEHQVTTINYPTKLGSAGTISRLLFRWQTASTGTNDTKFVLANFTRGNKTDTLTVTKALKEFALDTKLKCEKDDQIALYCIQVDAGGTEYTNGICEMTIIKRV